MCPTTVVGKMLKGTSSVWWWRGGGVNITFKILCY
jgi:hypothetical protein